MDNDIIYISKNNGHINKNIHEKVNKKNIQTNKRNSNLYKKKTISDTFISPIISNRVTVMNINDNLQKKDRKVLSIPVANIVDNNIEKIDPKPSIMFEKYIDEINERMKKVNNIKRTQENIKIVKNIIRPAQTKTIFHDKPIQMATLTNSETPEKKVICSIKKDSILIYQNQNMHTEVIGMFMYNFLDFDIHIYLGDKTNVSNSIPYYENIFKKKIEYVNDINEDMYKIIIILTAGELEMVPNQPNHKFKYILVNHESATINKNYYNISLTPIVKSNMYLLPVYDYLNNNHRAFIITIIGSLHNHQRDMKNIIKMVQNYTEFKICIFTRYIDKTLKDTLQKYKNFVLYEKTSTNIMMEVIRKSRFIYTADTENYTENGIRGGILTGMIPLGLNNNIPLIMTKRLNLIYNLKGVLLYENDIMELHDNIKNMEHAKYKELLSLSVQDKKNRCIENKIKFGLIKEKIMNPYISR